MASSEEYLKFVLDKLKGLEYIKYRKMMNEYIIYYKGKIVGGIYDNRLLIKPVKSALAYIKNIKYELPYDGAKNMILVDEIDDSEYLKGLFECIWEELPLPKKKNS